MKLNSIISCSIGNILEWYDFGLFAIFSPFFSQIFFPSSDPHTALIETFTIFALGFFCRPIGALLFGYLGDRRGRAITLRLSILMISLPTLFIGCLPVYHSVGIISPILLMLIRIWQGISLGGEYSGSIIYLGEGAPNHRRSFLTSLAASGANIGILLAMIVGMLMNFLFNDMEIKQWAWRLPYVISGIFCLIIYATRLNLQETRVFHQAQVKHLILKNPIRHMFQHNLRDVMRTLGLICMGSTFYYFTFIYLPLVLKQDLQFSLYQTTRLETIFIASMVLLVPLAGLLSDKIGRYRMLLFNAMIICLITIPGYYFLHHSLLFSQMVFVLFLFTLASSLEQGTTPAVIVENFPVAARYTGLSFAYNLGNGFLGGSIPLICTWLVSHTHYLLSPAFYIVFYAVITLTIAIFIYQKKRGASSRSL